MGDNLTFLLGGRGRQATVPTPGPSPSTARHLQSHPSLGLRQRPERARERKREEGSHSNFIEHENSYAIYENWKREGGVLSLHVEKCSSVIQKNEVFDCCQAQVSFLSWSRIFFLLARKWFFF